MSPVDRVEFAIDVLGIKRPSAVRDADETLDAVAVMAVVEVDHVAGRHK